MVKGTNTYRYKLIKNVNTLDSAVENCIEAYNELRAEVDVLETEASLVKGSININSDIDKRKIDTLIKTKRQKSREIGSCVDDFLKLENKKVDSGLLEASSYRGKKKCLINQLGPYLNSIGVNKTIQITNNTFNEYPIWRKASKSTRKLELIHIKEFIDNYCYRNGLINGDVNMKGLMPVIRISESELDANPPLIEEGNWNEVLKGLKNIRDRVDINKNHRGEYFNKLFYRWCLIAKNSGLRPNVELNKLRWCDVKRENVGRWSSSEKTTKDKFIATIYIRKTKTGKQRTVPTNGVDSQLKAWKKEQEEYLERHYPSIEVNEETLIFGNPANEMKAYSYCRFDTKWRGLIEAIGSKLKPYVFSERNYTIYSLRSTYICTLILQGKDIYTTAKLAGHTVAVCERYYARLDMQKKSKQVTDFKYGKKGARKSETDSYMKDDGDEESLVTNKKEWIKDEEVSYKRTSRKDRTTINRSKAVTNKEQ